MSFSARGRWMVGVQSAGRTAGRNPSRTRHRDLKIRASRRFAEAREEWCLSAFPSGVLIWGNCSMVFPRTTIPIPRLNSYMEGVSRQKVLELWLKLAAGDIAAVEAEPWLPGSH